MITFDVDCKLHHHWNQNNPLFMIPGNVRKKGNNVNLVTVKFMLNVFTRTKAMKFQCAKNEEPVVVP